jgi:hypothetical protein
LRSAEDIRKSLAIWPKLAASKLAHFLELAPVFQPFAEDIDHAADGGIGLVLNGHGTAPLVAGMAEREGSRSARHCAGSNGGRRSYPPLEGEGRLA